MDICPHYELLHNLLPTIEGGKPCSLGQLNTRSTLQGKSDDPGTDMSMLKDYFNLTYLVRHEASLQGSAPEGYSFVDEEEEYVVASNGRSGSWQPVQVKSAPLTSTFSAHTHDLSF